MATNEKKCVHCGSNKTHLAVNEEGTTYQKWNSNPYLNATDRNMRYMNMVGT